MLPQPINGILTLSTVTPPKADLQWAAPGGADHYDLYRSINPLSIGSKINIAPLHDSGAPSYVIVPQDDGILTISAPPIGQTIYYKLVAADALGNYGLMSDSIAVTLENTEFVQDPVLAIIVNALRSDPTLLAMVGGKTENIRFHKRIREIDDTYPFVVIWRMDWKENPKFKDERMGTLTYKISVVHNQSSSQIVVNVLNRIAQLLDGDPGKDIFNGNSSVMVMMSMFMGGGPESFSEAPKLWFQEATLKLEVQLFAT